MVENKFYNVEFHSILQDIYIFITNDVFSCKLWYKIFVHGSNKFITNLFSQFKCDLI
jgi:hypothetical protein